MELEVLNGGVRGWEGEDLSCLGEILQMGSVAIGPDFRDRYLVLFRSTLLMLSVSQRMSAFLYEVSQLYQFTLKYVTVNYVQFIFIKGQINVLILLCCMKNLKIE